nr:MAG: capsid protein [Cressdnaviricota sp.]
MPRLSKQHSALLKGLAKQHASNAIVKRQVNRAITGLKKSYNKSARSGAITRGMAGLGNRLYGHDGKLVGEALGRGITGSGDYKMHHKSANKIEHGRMSDRKSNLEKGQMSISHTEFISIINSGSANPSAFTATSFNINPANSQMFPFLSSIAGSFQQWKANKMTIHLRSLCSESTGSTYLVSQGTGGVCCQYDSALGPFNSYITAINSDFAITAKCSQDMSFCIECNPHYNVLGEYYTSPNQTTTGNTSGISNSDLRMNQPGILTIFSANVPTNGSAIPLYECWISYEIILLKPTITGQYANILSGHWQGTTSNIEGSLFAGGVMVANANNQLSLTFTSDTFTFPSNLQTGQYLCCYYGLVAAQTTLSPITGTNFTITNGTIVNIWSGSPGSNLAQAPLAISGGASITAYTLTFIISINNPENVGCKVTFAGSGTQGTNFTNCDFVVTPFNINIIS